MKKIQYMNHKFTTVDIAIPAYKPLFFEQTLKSAIGQTYSHVNVLVSDDCPTDEILKICLKYPQVNYLKNPTPGGISNILHSLHMGNGDLIKPLFDDDLLHPFCVERMVEAINSYENIGLVFSASSHIDTNNIKTHLRRPLSHSQLIFDHNLRKEMLSTFKNFIGEFSSILFRRDHFSNFKNDDIFKYMGEPFIKGLSDVVAYFNLTKERNAYYIDEELSYFRTGDGHISNSNAKSNPEFFYAITDWIKLLLISHEKNSITDEELLLSKKAVYDLKRAYAENYPEVSEYVSNFEKKIGLIIKSRNIGQRFKSFFEMG